MCIIFRITISFTKQSKKKYPTCKINFSRFKKEKKIKLEKYLRERKRIARKKEKKYLL